MLAQEIIRLKRDCQSLSSQQIKSFVDGLTDHNWSEGQVAALAMAIYFNGMSRHEVAELTLAMTGSGRIIDWSKVELAGPIVDKHSTGGVGDNVSLMLAPMLAACGAYVPMISGRGLGHTGGTLDKCDSIPGYRTQPDEATFVAVVKKVGCAIIGQTSELSPADKRFYAIRDVTGTVESIPLITASILSKKCAAGLQALVMDIKYGNGAFMADQEQAQALARSIVNVAKQAGLSTTALLTDMNQPLASCAGNAVEMHNAVAFLSGSSRESRLQEVVLALGSALLVTSGLFKHQQEAKIVLQSNLDNGKATEIFSEMVSELGGPKDFVEKKDHYLPKASIIRPILASQNGYVARIDTRAVGVAVIDLGGGRTKTSDRIDHAVGFSELKPLGVVVEKGEPLAWVHANSESNATAASQRVCAAYHIGEPPQIGPVILEEILAD